MRLASYIAQDGPSFGVVREDGIVDLRRRMATVAGIRALLALPDGVATARSFADAHPDIDLDAVRLVPPVPDAERIICIGLNYRSYAEETGVPPPTRPVVFPRWRSSLVGGGQVMWRPRNSTQLDFEGELAVIMGQSARHVTRATALNYVAGYTCFNDGSVRDWQKHSTQVTAGKNFPRSGSYGPWMITADELPDPSGLMIRTTVNQTMVQCESTSDMFFDVPSLIEYLSSFTILEPGDVIATGTPAGVGVNRRPKAYLGDGDTVTVAIEGIGSLTNSVAPEPTAEPAH